MCLMVKNTWNYNFDRSFQTALCRGSAYINTLFAIWVSVFSHFFTNRGCSVKSCYLSAGLICTSLVMSQESLNISFFVNCLITTLVYFSVWLLSFIYTYLPAPGWKPIVWFSNPSVGHCKALTGWASQGMAAPTRPEPQAVHGSLWRSLRLGLPGQPWS